MIMAVTIAHFSIFQIALWCVEYFHYLLLYNVFILLASVTFGCRFPCIYSTIFAGFAIALNHTVGIVVSTFVC